MIALLCSRGCGLLLLFQWEAASSSDARGASFKSSKKSPSFYHACSGSFNKLWLSLKWICRHSVHRETPVSVSQLAHFSPSSNCKEAIVFIQTATERANSKHMIKTQRGDFCKRMSKESPPRAKTVRAQLRGREWTGRGKDLTVNPRRE